MILPPTSEISHLHNNITKLTVTNIWGNNQESQDENTEFGIQDGKDVDGLRRPALM